MTLKTFLSHCQFYDLVAVYHSKLLIDADSAYNLLHLGCPSIVSRYDNEVDFFTVDGCGNIVCVLCA